MSQLLQLWAWWVSLVWELSRAPTVSVLLTIWLCCWAFSSCYMDWLGFPGGSDNKEPACSEGDLGSVCGLGRSPRGGHGNPLQHSCLENPPGQRSLVGYSPQGCKELDMTEWLSTTRGWITWKSLSSSLAVEWEAAWYPGEVPQSLCAVFLITHRPEVAKACVFVVPT